MCLRGAAGRGESPQLRKILAMSALALWNPKALRAIWSAGPQQSEPVRTRLTAERARMQYMRTGEPRSFVLMPGSASRPWVALGHFAPMGGRRRLIPGSRFES